MWEADRGVVCVPQAAEVGGAAVKALSYWQQPSARFVGQVKRGDRAVHEIRFANGESAQEGVAA